MTKKADHKVYTYLKECGVLDHGTDKEIETARKEYWRIYKRNWRKNKRMEETEVTASFNDSEFKKLDAQAKTHNLSHPQFVKKTVLAYMDKKYLVPNELEVRKISQLLSQYLDVITDEIEENNLTPDTGDMILHKIEELEYQIMILLREPKQVV
ncbi:MAG: hypothetical protein ACKVQV_14195 [Bacteroidia bacterium]